MPLLQITSHVITEQASKSSGPACRAGVLPRAQGSFLPVWDSPSLCVSQAVTIWAALALICRPLSRLRLCILGKKTTEVRQCLLGAPGGGTSCGEASLPCDQLVPVTSLHVSSPCNHRAPECRSSRPGGTPSTSHASH